MKPDLDQWMPTPGLQVSHRREASAPGDGLWDAARRLRVGETAMLGRLIRWRIPGTPADVSFDELFQSPPFILLDGDMDGAMISGLVGRIWTLRRDYPHLNNPEEFRSWSRRGTARVVFGIWVESAGEGRSALVSETRVEAVGNQGRLGVAAVRPLVRSFHNLVGSDGIETAVRLAEREASSAHAKH